MGKKNRVLEEFPDCNLAVQENAGRANSNYDLENKMEKGNNWVNRNVYYIE